MLILLKIQRKIADWSWFTSQASISVLWSHIHKKTKVYLVCVLCSQYHGPVWHSWWLQELGWSCIGIGRKKGSSKVPICDTLLYLLSVFHLRHFECLWSDEESSKVRKSKKTNKEFQINTALFFSIHFLHEFLCCIISNWLLQYSSFPGFSFLFTVYWT